MQKAHFLTWDETIEGILNLMSGKLNILGKKLTFDVNAGAVIGASDTTYIIANNTGEVKKNDNSPNNASFEFPIGDSSFYTPISYSTMNASGPGTISVRVTNSAHPDNKSINNYLKRYWSVSQNGYNNFSTDVSARYADVDIVPNENEIAAAELINIPPWIKFDPVDAATNTLTANGINELGIFTGIDNSSPSFTISADPDFEVCQNTILNLTADVDQNGAAPFTYLWSTGATTATAFLIPTGSPGTTAYTVTVTDDNGITKSDSKNVIVNPKPPAPVFVAGDSSACPNSWGSFFSVDPDSNGYYIWSTIPESLPQRTGKNNINQTNNNFLLFLHDADSINAGEVLVICKFVDTTTTTRCDSTHIFHVTISGNSAVDTFQVLKMNDDPVILGAFQNGGGSQIHYLWGYNDTLDLSDDTIPGEINQVIIFDGSTPEKTFQHCGRLYWCEISLNGCVVRNYYNLTNCINREGVQLADNSVIVFPSPNSGTFVIQANGFAGQNVSIEVIDVGGKKILKQNTLSQELLQGIKLHLTLPQGIYIVKAADENGKSLITKFIVQQRNQQ